MTDLDGVYDTSLMTEGDHLAILRSLRDRLATQIDSTSSARDLAPLASRLVEVLSEISRLDPPEVEPEVESPLAEVLRLAREAKAPPQTG